MTVTVDVVIVGANQRALAAAVESAQGGSRVLVIARMRDRDLRRRIRRARRAAGIAVSKRIRVLTGAEVECIAGLRTIEAVLARYIQTGRRIDVNAASLLMLENELETKTSVQKRGTVRW